MLYKVWLGCGGMVTKAPPVSKNVWWWSLNFFNLLTLLWHMIFCASSSIFFVYLLWQLKVLFHFSGFYFSFCMFFCFIHWVRTPFKYYRTPITQALAVGWYQGFFGLLKLGFNTRLITVFDQICLNKDWLKINRILNGYWVFSTSVLTVQN